MRKVAILVFVLLLAVVPASNLVVAQGVNWTTIIDTPVLFDGSQNGGDVTDGQVEPIQDALLGRNCFRVTMQVTGKPDEFVVAVNQHPNKRFGFNTMTLISAPGLYAVDIPFSAMQVVDPNFGNLVPDTSFDPTTAHDDYFIMRLFVGQGDGSIEVKRVMIANFPNCQAAAQLVITQPAEKGKLCTTATTNVVNTGGKDYADFPSNWSDSFGATIYLVLDSAMYPISFKLDAYYADGDFTRFEITKLSNWDAASQNNLWLTHVCR